MTVPTPVMTGYDTEDRYFATRYLQGERVVYSIDLSLAGVAATLPKPDPDRPTPGNRKVKVKHAHDFSKYVRENKAWVAPALLLRAPDIFTFEVKENVGGTQFGILGLPRLARTDIRILDGQHRILGLHTAVEEIAVEMERARTDAAAARRNGDPASEAVIQKKVRALEIQRERLNRERISIQIHIEDDKIAFEQMFVDIADNALGISSAIRVRFDNRKIVNRVLEEVMKHAFLKNRVDMEQDRIGGASTNLLGAKHVADIVRTITVGLAGRIGRRQEAELQESAVVQHTNDFFDILLEGFPVLEDMVEDKVTPDELRKISLLGSTTMLRVLAGVYHDLSQDYSDDDISDFFLKLAPHMKVPVAKGSPWVATDVIAAGANAPKARRQDLENLARHIAGWCKNTPEWLKAA